MFAQAMAMRAKMAAHEFKPKTEEEERRFDGDAWIVVWWMAQDPQMAVFRNKESAEAAAKVRNALLIHLQGRGRIEGDSVDFYRRDDAGNGIPIGLRDLFV